MLILRCQGQKRTKQDKPEQAQSTVIFIWVHLWVQIWVFKKSARPAFQGILLMGSFSGTIFYGTKSIPIYAINPIAPAPRIMLDAVCERIFKGSLGKREKDAVPFKLEVATRQWFNTITAPEYCFTRSTLYEVLMEIGGTKEVNAVPRLLWNEQTNAFDTITFIKQGDSTDEYTLPSGVKLTGEEVDINADEYCEEFDSYAENMVNTLDAQRGSIVEPANFIDSPDAYYKTCRSEELVITDNTSIIECDRGIYKPISLRAAYEGKSADITPYLFEAAEYDNLTSYKGIPQLYDLSCYLYIFINTFTQPC